MVKKQLITGTIIILASLWATPVSAARIIFQDDIQGTVSSNSIVLGSDKAGAANTAIQFGADLIPAENGNITWDISSNSFTVDHTVNITGDLNVTGNTSFPATTSDSYTIDSDDSAASVKLSFGSALTKIIEYDTANGWFNISNRLNIAGAGGVNGVKLTTRAGSGDVNQPQIEVRDSSNAAVFSADEKGNVTMGGLNNSTLVFDSDNTGAGTNINIVANQGTDPAGTLRYNSVTNTWQISNNGGLFADIPASAMGGGTLDQTYDYGGSGAGRTVIVDSGAIKFDATSGTFAPLELTPRSTAPTTGLSDGQLMTMGGLLYQYDSARAKWLSVESAYPVFSRASSDGTYLDIGGAAGPNTGFVLPRNATITSISASVSGGPNTKIFYVRRNANAANLLTLALPSAFSVYNATANVDLNAGDYVQVITDPVGQAVTDPVFSVGIKWRP